MLAYYRLAGVNALTSIVLNLLILLGLVALIPVTMTLPGIAGLILTIGMGVDSNVLIFERIKEELSRGRTARAAVARRLRSCLDHDRRHPRHVAHCGRVSLSVRDQCNSWVRDDPDDRPGGQRVHGGVRVEDAVRTGAAAPARRRHGSSASAGRHGPRRATINFTRWGWPAIALSAVLIAGRRRLDGDQRPSARHRFLRRHARRRGVRAAGRHRGPGARRRSRRCPAMKSCSGTDRRATGGCWSACRSTSEPGADASLEAGVRAGDERPAGRRTCRRFTMREPRAGERGHRRGPAAARALRDRRIDRRHHGLHRRPLQTVVRGRRRSPPRSTTSLVTLACLSLAGYDLSLNVTAALLTIIGYSVNDTIVDLRSGARERQGDARQFRSRRSSISA